MTRSSSRSVLPSLVKLAVFAVVTIALTALLAQTLGSLGWLGGTRYKAQFTDVTGLLQGDDIRIAGVKVGQVKDIELVHGKTAQVSFTLDDTITVPKSVRAKIRYRNLIGQRYVELTEGSGDGGEMRPGDVIPVSHTEPALDLTVLFNGFQPLFAGLSPKDVNKFAYEIIQVLQGEGGTVNDLLARTASLTNTLADRDKVIGRVIDNLNQVLATLNARGTKLSDTIGSLQDFVSGLAADRRIIGDSIQSLGDLTGSTADLVQQGRPALREDIRQLRTLAGTLNANSTVIEGTLARLPVRFNALARTASYGSWLNFYMCNFDGSLNVPGVGTVNPTTFSAAAARCEKGGTPATPNPKKSGGSGGGGGR
ncbi:MCE family protein [Actinocatenispora rupis]|uniref:ABC transporter substrate-binding protein n=1 Tax=Actinocatenispora rupis TaxID=519421 RepID=A0A8J3J4P7_9ACTN|nr:MlaD family protein [Actinocatenispora rupis]GID11566.1 ABC transporter substrate-binding protein [Actinocatenispora rupis]